MAAKYKAGGAEGNRTPDLLIANEALYQLSYSPALSARRGMPSGARQVKLQPGTLRLAKRKARVRRRLGD